METKTEKRSCNRGWILCSLCGEVGFRGVDQGLCKEIHPVRIRCTHPVHDCERFSTTNRATRLEGAGKLRMGGSCGRAVVPPSRGICSAASQGCRVLGSIGRSRSTGSPGTHPGTLVEISQ